MVQHVLLEAVFVIAQIFTVFQSLFLLDSPVNLDFEKYLFESISGHFAALELCSGPLDEASRSVITERRKPLKQRALPPFDRSYGF